MIASVWSIIFGIFYGEIFGPLGLWNYMFGMLSHHEIVALEEAAVLSVKEHMDLLEGSARWTSSRYIDWLLTRFCF